MREVIAGFKRVWLASTCGGPTEEPILRAAAGELAAWAVGYGKGADSGMLEHEVVTEGRYTRWLQAKERGEAWAQKCEYSSCGDLCHFLLSYLGCRDESVVNRDDDGGTHPWAIGVNISRLSTDHPALRPNFALTQCGDFVFVNNKYGGHICVVRSWDLDAKQAVTSDYGQPCGRQRTKVIGVGPNPAAAKGWTLGGDPIGFVFDISKVAYAETARVPEQFEIGTPDTCPYPEQNA